MKNLLTLLLIVVFQFATAQTIVKLNFNVASNQFVTSENSLRGKAEYKFQVCDYNSVLYSPVVKVSAQRHKVLVPDAFKAYVSFVDFQRDLDLYPVNLPSVSPQLSESNEMLEMQIQEVDEQVKEINVMISGNMTSLDLVNKQLTLNRNQSRPNGSIETQLTKVSNDLVLHNKFLEYQKLSLENYAATLKKRKATASPSPIVATVNKFTEEYQRLRSTEEIFTKMKEDLSNAKDLAGCKQIVSKARASLMSRYGVTTDDMKLLQEKFNLTVNTCSALKESLSIQLAGRAAGIDATTQEKIDQALIASEYVSSKRADLQNWMSSFSRLFPKSELLETNKYTHQYDYALISVKLVNNLNPKDTVFRQNVKLYTRGGLDVDFSTGLMGNTIYKESWYVDTVGVNTIKTEKVFKADIAFGALINFSYRVSYRDRAGLSIGPAVSLLDGGARYMVGAHYYVGRRDLLGLSAGLCWGKRNFLSKTISENGTDPNPNLPATITAVTTYEKFAMGFYVGIFYNFARL